jgi:hypothetical protein
MIGVDWIAGLLTTAARFDMIQNHVDLLSVCRVSERNVRYSSDGRRRHDRDVMGSQRILHEAVPLLLFSAIRISTVRNGISRITSVTRISNHTLVITPNRIGSRPPYPSRDDGGHDTIRAHVHSFRPGTPGDVTVGGAAPVHPSSSLARSRRGLAAGRPVGCL